MNIFINVSGLKDVQNIFNWVKKDLFGLFWNRGDTQTKTMKQV
jgi:hypothetical protein